MPPGPPFPEPIHGDKVCAVVWYYSGDLERNDLEEVLSVVNDPAPPAFHFTAPMPYPALQSTFDEEIPKGLQWYWRGDFFETISGAAIEVHERYGRGLPNDLSAMHLYPVDGAAHRVGADETAWAYRDAKWSGVVGGIDPEPANADMIRQWCVDYWTDLHPHSMGGSYVNFIGAQEGPNASSPPTGATSTASPRSSAPTTRTTSSTPTRTSHQQPPEEGTGQDELAQAARNHRWQLRPLISTCRAVLPV